MRTRPVSLLTVSLDRLQLVLRVNQFASYFLVSTNPPLISSPASLTTPSTFTSPSPSTTQSPAYETRSSRRRERLELERQQRLERRRVKKASKQITDSGSDGEGDDDDDEDEEEEVDEFYSDVKPTNVRTVPLPSTEVQLKQLGVEEPLENKRGFTDLTYYEDEDDEDDDDGKTGFGKRRRGRYYRRGMRSLSTSWKTITHSTKQLFSKRVFKGVGLSFVKPIGGDLKSMGVGFKIPITNHFPLYDSNICLPRLIAFVGVNYPLSYKVSFTLSVPIQAVQIYLLVLLQANPSQWPQVKASDHVKRLGLTWSLKIPAKFPSNKIWYKALSSSWGPVFNFLPGSKLIQAMLPFVVFTPTLLIAVVMYFFTMGKELNQLLRSPFISKPLRTQQYQQSTMSDSTGGNGIKRTLLTPSITPVSATALYAENGRSSGENSFILPTSRRSWQLENSLMTRYENAVQMVSNWLTQKSPAFGSAFGYSNRVRSMSINFDLQPFYLLWIRDFIIKSLTLADQMFFACLDSLFYVIFLLNQSIMHWRKSGKFYSRHRPMTSSSTSLTEDDFNPTSMSYERVGSFSANSPDSLIDPREFASRLKAKKQLNQQPQTQSQQPGQWRGGSRDNHDNSGIISPKNSGYRKRGKSPK